MCSKGILRSTYSPYMQVMHLYNAFYAIYTLHYLVNVYMSRNTVYRQTQAIGQQTPGRNQYYSCHNKTDDRVDNGYPPPHDSQAR